MSTVGSQNDPLKYKFVRSPDGVFMGVCKGLSQSLGIDLPLLRLIWLVALLCYGTGFVLYFILAASLPRADRLDHALDSKLLGVCARIAERYSVEVGLVRAGFILFTGMSAGLGGVFLYVACYFLVPNNKATAGR